MFYPTNLTLCHLQHYRSTTSASPFTKLIVALAGPFNIGTGNLFCFCPGIDRPVSFCHEGTVN